MGPFPVYEIYGIRFVAMQRAQLESIITPAVEACACQFWGLEFLSHSKHRVLRIYIDTRDGVDVDQCAIVSQQISAILDVAGSISDEYTLEVSSPGLDRPLFILPHYEENIGAVISLRLREAFEGRRNFKGLLVAVESSSVVLQLDQDEYVLPFGSIEKANIVPLI